MDITNPARAGSMESNDIYIMLLPSSEGIIVELESKVIKQFGKKITNTILEVLKEHNISSVKILAKDSGALDYTIKSRVTTAVKRSLKEGVHD